ncbi:MAG: GGDEF domain-containing protein [Anaerolineaceae bacterium]|nr:GGDEF domain-containing protein [Anaerolineaceae bacterium]
MKLFNQIIHVDFVVVVTLLYLSVFMYFNRAYDKKINGSYMVLLGLLAALVISDNFDYYYSQLPYPTPIHSVFIMAGYILRILLICAATFILYRDSMTKRKAVLLLIPAVLNIFVILSAPFHKNVFWIDENNVLHREILSYFPHAMSLIYFVILVIFTAKQFRKGYHHIGWLLSVSLFSFVVAVVAEIVLKTRGVLISAMLLMGTFYYLYLHMEHFKRDYLTGALNRMSFFADLERFHPGNITAFCEIDMNNLKRINDVNGHAAGDKAIKTMSKIILNCLPRQSYLYCLGGDEFAILFCSTTMEKCEETINRIRKEMTETDYRCGIGLAPWDPTLPFESIYNLADKRMYEDKKQIKG